MDTQQLGEGIFATAHEPGDPDSVINWRGVNYVPQPEPPEGQLLVDQMRSMEQRVSTPKGTGTYGGPSPYGDDPFDPRDTRG